MILPFDIANPPEDPPDGADRLLWILAWSIHSEHGAGPDGLCQAASCRGIYPQVWPCGASRLAQGGFVFASWHLRKPIEQEPLPCK